MFPSNENSGPNAPCIWPACNLTGGDSSKGIAAHQSGAPGNAGTNAWTAANVSNVLRCAKIHRKYFGHMDHDDDAIPGYS